MKSTGLLMLGILAISCNPILVGPVANIFRDEHYWELTNYSVKGDSKSLDSAKNFYFINFANNSNTINEDINIFNKDQEKLDTWSNETQSWSINKKRTEGTYIKRNSAGKYFKVKVYIHNSDGNVYRLELGNLMDYAYKAEHDSLLYTYKPTAKF